MAIAIDYKGWKFEFDHFPSADELEARYQERVAKLAGARETHAAEQGILEGEVPLAPIQKWFFEHEFREISHWNHGVRWTPSRSYGIEVWESAWRAIVEQHDSLRLRFEETPAGWKQHYGPIEGAAAFEVASIRGTDATELDTNADEAIRRAHASLDIVNGPLARMVYLDYGGQRGDQVLVVIHHLGIGGFSWTILAGDIQETAARLADGSDPGFPAKTTSFREWARKIDERTVSAQEVEYWLNGEFDQAAFAPPSDHDALRRDCVEATAAVVHQTLEHDLVRPVLGADKRVRTLLLGALAHTLADWTDNEQIAIALEGNARSEKLVDGVDLSRSIGWFNTMYPVLFRRSKTGSEAEIAAELAAVPVQTNLYLMARYGAGAEPWRQRLRTRNEPEVLFNYYGLLGGEDAQRAIEDIRLMRGPGNQRSHAHELYVYHDGERLSCDWIYSPELHEPETIEHRALQLLDRVAALLA